MKFGRLRFQLCDEFMAIGAYVNFRNANVAFPIYPKFDLSEGFQKAYRERSPAGNHVSGLIAGF